MGLHGNFRKFSYGAKAHHDAVDPFTAAVPVFDSDAQVEAAAVLPTTAVEFDPDEFGE